MTYRQLLLLWLICSSATTSIAADNPQPKPTSPAQVRNDQAALDTAFRLGSSMREIAYRFSNAYWAANGGNWGLAQYQLLALSETLRTVQQRSPTQSAMLNEFLIKYNDPLLGSIQGMDLVQFNQKFTMAMNGCNDCHAKHERGFLRYVVPEPSSTGAFLDFSARTKPPHQESLIK